MNVFFSQSVAVLCSQCPDLGALRAHLEAYGQAVSDMQETSPWPEMEGPSLTLAWKPGARTTCKVDLCATPWPDDMGQSGENKLVLGAHAMGAYGPCVHPGALQRGLRNRSSGQINELVEKHAAFVRLRITGTMLEKNGEGAQADVRESPAEQLQWLIELAATFSAVPEALLYFNAGGEVIMTLEELRTFVDNARASETFPMPAATAVRNSRISDQWQLMDSVGMAQFHLPDHEFAVPARAVSLDELALHLLNLEEYQIRSGAVISGGHTVDGPGETIWRAEARGIACLMPPRSILHWTLEGSPAEPPQLARKEGDAPPAAAAVPEATPEPLAEHEAAMLKIVNKIEAWLVHKDGIRSRAIAWLRSPAFERTDNGGQKLTKVEIEILCTQGQVVFAQPIIANTGFEANPDTDFPCLLVMSDEQSAWEIGLAGVLADVLGEIYFGIENESHHPKSAKLVQDDTFRRFRRRPLPKAETDGQAFTLLDVQMRNNWMRPDDVPFVPLLMQPGNAGPVVQIPWHVVCGSAPVPAAAPASRPGARPGGMTLEQQKQAIAARNAAKEGGCAVWFTRLILAVFLCGLAAGGYRYLMGERPARKSKKEPVPQTVSSVQSWSQPAVLKSKFTPVNADSYQSLAAGANGAAAFLFKVEAGLILAASNRQASGRPDQPHGTLSDPGGLTVTLDTEQMVRQPLTLVQIVTEVSKDATCLEYRTSDLVKPGDALRVILGKGQWIEGKAAEGGPAGGHRLSQQARMLSLTVTRGEVPATGISGAPVTDAATGRVVGAGHTISRADGSTTIRFETLGINLGYNKAATQ